MVTEDQLEQLTLEWFQSIGYDTICWYGFTLDTTCTMQIKIWKLNKIITKP